MKIDSIHTPILEIQDLSVSYRTNKDNQIVLRDINLRIHKGQIYGLVGESGSGKTTLGLAILQYLPPDGFVTNGKVFLRSKDLSTFQKSDLRSIWGKEISFVPQDPSSALNPSLRVGDQLAEAIHTHQNLRKKISRDQANDWLHRVKLPSPKHFANKYPHELSGGQKQRVLLAMAFSSYPQLLILDEPTTNLDVTTEAVIIDLLCDLIQEHNTSALFITHKLSLLVGFTNRVAVLYAGELVEDAKTHTLLHQPLHPYTQGLINCNPRLDHIKDKYTLQGIPGRFPSSLNSIEGCIFAPRCELSQNHCFEKRPGLEVITTDTSIRCHRWPEILSEEIALSVEDQPPPRIHNQEPLKTLQANHINVSYQIQSNWLKSILGKRNSFKAVDSVSLQIGKGKTLGIVGESGSGKSSLALAIMGLQEFVEGEIYLLNLKLPNSLKTRDRSLMRQVQMVFQNQDEIFSPFVRIEEILSRPLMNLLSLDSKSAKNRVKDLLRQVQLPVDYAQRYPRQLSGGEKQRVAIALALASYPNLLIFDEPVSALDVSVQAKILNLLKKIQLDYLTSNLIISHDISVITYMADEVAVMYLGQIMQLSSSQHILHPPYHPYTEALLSAVPMIDTDRQSQGIRLEGDIPDPIDKPQGCPFHTRCPHFIGSICTDSKPPWQTTQQGEKIFCHIPVEELKSRQIPLKFQGITGQEK